MAGEGGACVKGVVMGACVGVARRYGGFEGSRYDAVTCGCWPTIRGKRPDKGQADAEPSCSVLGGVVRCTVTVQYLTIAKQSTLQYCTPWGKRKQRESHKAAACETRLSRCCEAK